MNPYDKDLYAFVDLIISHLKPNEPNEPSEFNEPKIIQNAVEADGVIYRSASRHDFVQLPDGRYIDGGHDYLRRGGYFTEEESLSLTNQSPWKEIHQKLTWGTYGIDGNQPLKWVRIKDMGVSHIQNVLNMFEGTGRLSYYQQVVLHYWLNRRKEYEEAVEWLAKHEEHVTTLVSAPYTLLFTSGGELVMSDLVEELRKALYYSTNALDGEK